MDKTYIDVPRPSGIYVLLMSCIPFYEPKAVRVKNKMATDGWTYETCQPSTVPHYDEYVFTKPK